MTKSTGGGSIKLAHKKWAQGFKINKIFLEDLKTISPDKILVPANLSKEVYKHIIKNSKVFNDAFTSRDPIQEAIDNAVRDINA
jgi:hypothetical protein